MALNYNDQSQNTPLLEGQIAQGVVTPEIFTGVNAGTTVIPFGRPVIAGTESAGDEIVVKPVSGTAASDVIGIAVLTNANERNDLTVDTLGSFGYEPNRPVAYTPRAIVGVVIEEDIDPNDKPFYRYRQSAAGTDVGTYEEIGRWRSDSDGAGTSADAVDFSSKARFLSGGNAGDVVPVQFFVF